MPDIFATFIVPAGVAEAARVAAANAPVSGGAGMFTTPLTGNPTDVITHYISGR